MTVGVAGTAIVIVMMFVLAFAGTVSMIREAIDEFRGEDE